MDWLSKYQAVIACAEKVVHIPWGNETLIIHGDGSNPGNATRLNIISCTKNEEVHGKRISYLLAHVTAKEAEDKSEKKRLEGVPIFLTLGTLVLFLGHMIDSEGIHVDPAKIESIKDWTSPKSPTEVRQFLGLAGCYQRFIEGKSCSAPILTLPEWKWDNITMDFVTKLPKSSQGYDTIWNALGTNLDMSTAYHLQTDGQSERTIQTLKDMLRACAIDFGKGWCRSPVCWTEVGEAQILGPELIQETTEKIIQIKQEESQSTRDRHKIYADLSVMERVGEVAHKLELPEELSRVHNTFHAPLEEVGRSINVEAKTEPLSQRYDGTPREVPEFTWERERPFQKKYPHPLPPRHIVDTSCNREP
ncbi:putative reverse transcriptase domain-containing protein [Tanacetum coccineum]